MQTNTTVIYSPSPSKQGIQHNISFKYPIGEESREEGVPQEMNGPPVPYPQGNGIVTFRSSGSNGRERSNSSRGDSLSYNYPRK